MAQYFWIGVNENDETGIDFNSFVDVPAHMKGMIHFSKEAVRYSFNDEKRMVTGVMIAANQPIYRWSPELGDHYVIFKADTIDLIRRKFFKNGYSNNLNVMHDPKQVQKGVTLVDSYIVSSTDPKLPKVPEALSAMNLQDGTWIASYFVENDELWNQVKEGKFGGFSVEGWFEKVKINTKNKMNKQKKSIWDLFTKGSPVAEKFAEAVTAEGVAVFYEGELAEGTAVFVELEGERIPAPEGEHELTLEDGTVKVITLNSDGVITAVVDVEAEVETTEVEASVEAENEFQAIPAEQVSEALETATEIIADKTGLEMGEAYDIATLVVNAINEIKVEVADAMRKQTSEIHNRFIEMEEKFNSMKSEMNTIQKGEKFGASPKAASSHVSSYRDLLNK
jgi:hypothetical protein